MHILDKNFFEQEAVVVAQELLGCILTYETKRGILSGKIVETEAYGGIDDKASHAAKGVTARNAVMFGEAGLAYIYLIYGMYNCFNIVCQYAEAQIKKARRLFSSDKLLETKMTTFRRK